MPSPTKNQESRDSAVITNEGLEFSLTPVNDVKAKGGASTSMSAKAGAEMQGASYLANQSMESPAMQE